MTDTSVSSTSSTASSVVANLTTALGSSSGIDFTALTTELVSAQYQPKLDALTSQNTKLTTQISGVSSIKSGITSFSSALTTLVKGGTLATQPTSSNTSILNVTGTGGASLAGYSASIQVQQLAAAQSVSTSPVLDATAALGTGTLTLTLGTGTVTNGHMTGFTAGSTTPVSIAIDSSNDTLAGVAAAINAKNAGVTASVVSDSDGTRLLIKGATGAAQAFTLTAAEDSSAPGLSAVNVGVGATGTTIGTAAQDALVSVDGVTLKRSTNSIKDLISGIQLDLVSASPGTTVTIGTQSPNSSISEAVSNFVTTYNQLLAVIQAQTDPATGTLSTDPAARSLTRSLSQITLTKLASSSDTTVPTTLADLGVGTNRDGTLSVDTTQLAAVLAKNPTAVEAMFADGSGSSGGGLAAALATISDAAIDTTTGLGASTARYTAAQSAIADQQTTIQTQETEMTTRLTAQFANTQSQLASYKATQSYLTAQIAAWNKPGS